MADRDVFDRRLDKLEQLLRKLRGLQPVALDTFLEDEDLPSKRCHPPHGPLGWLLPVGDQEEIKLLDVAREQSV